MKIVPCITLLASTCLQFVPALAAATDAKRPPSAIDILQRGVNAHRRIGPVSVTITNQVTMNGLTAPASSVSVQKLNDPRHYVTTTWLLVDDKKYNPTTTYVNGDTEVWFDKNKQEYRREKKVRPDETTAIINGIADSLARPDQRVSLAKAKVEALVIERLPVWRLSWLETSPGRSAQEATRVTLIVGRADALARKYSFINGDGRGGTTTWAYQHQKKPFPAKTFIFSPPPGATRVDK